MSQQSSNLDPGRAIVAAVVLVLFAIGFVVILISVASSRSSEIPFTTFALTAITQSLGALIAILTSAVLLGRAIAGASVRNLTPLLLPLLAGLALASSHWAAAIALGAMGITAIIKEMVPRPEAGLTED